MGEYHHPTFFDSFGNNRSIGRTIDRRQFIGHCSDYRLNSVSWNKCEGYFVNFTNQLRPEEKPLEAAIREAGEIRFPTIVLLSIIAIGGLNPLALNTNPLISRLAFVLIGGLISSTLILKIVTPVMYKMLSPKL